MGVSVDGFVAAPDGALSRACAWVNVIASSPKPDELRRCDRARTSRDSPIGRAFADRVAGTDGSRDDDPGVHAAQPQLAADPGVDEPPRVAAESGGELGAAQVWLVSNLDDRRAQGKPGAGRQVSRAEVEIGVELITG